MRFTKDEKRKIGMALFVIICSVLIFTVLQNIPIIWNLIGSFIKILSPFWVALAMAFLVNMPMKMIETKLLHSLKLPKNMLRALSMLLSYLLVLAAIALLLSTVIPQIIDSIKNIVTNIPSLADNIKSLLKGADWAEPFLNQLNDEINKINNSTIKEYLETWVTADSQTMLTGWLNQILGTISNVFSGFFSFLLALFFSIYILNSKEVLSRQCKELLYSIIPEKQADRFMYIGYTAYDNFYNFFTGQLLEAFVLALMNFIGMSILKMPYAIVISCIIAIGALIPMLGAIMAGIFGVLIILTADPVLAIGYAVFIIVLQQFDGNLTYPKIVGKSVGLPSIWVLLAVTIGGAVYGILGMLVSVPIASTLYDILIDFKTKQLAKREIQIELK